MRWKGWNTTRQQRSKRVFCLGFQINWLVATQKRSKISTFIVTSWHIMSNMRQTFWTRIPNKSECFLTFTVFDEIVEATKCLVVLFFVYESATQWTKWKCHRCFSNVWNKELQFKFDMKRKSSAIFHLRAKNVINQLSGERDISIMNSVRALNRISKSKIHHFWFDWTFISSVQSIKQHARFL